MFFVEGKILIFHNFLFNLIHFISLKYLKNIMTQMSLGQDKKEKGKNNEYRNLDQISNQNFGQHY